MPQSKANLQLFQNPWHLLSSRRRAFATRPASQKRSEVSNFHTSADPHVIALNVQSSAALAYSWTFNLGHKKIWQLKHPGRALFEPNPHQEAAVHLPTPRHHLKKNTSWPCVAVKKVVMFNDKYRKVNIHKCVAVLNIWKRHDQPPKEVPIFETNHFFEWWRNHPSKSSNTI